MSEQALHIPVLLSEVLDVVKPQPGMTIIDATFGAGGYTRAFLERGANVIAFDRDPDAIKNGQALVQSSNQKLTLIHAPFSQMQEKLEEHNLGQVDAVVFDLGVSSMQIDQAARGFSFRFDGPLDMRMSQAGQSAADLVNNLPEKELADLIFTYGDERKSRLIAKAIVHDRDAKPFTGTLQLAEMIKRIIRQNPAEKTHPATRTFQALRIAVNDEMGELEQGLQGAKNVLKTGGCLAAVTFHSLEDRVVKRFLSDEKTASRHLPPTPTQQSGFEIMVSKPLTASMTEQVENPRSKSAKLRAARKK